MNLVNAKNRIAEVQSEISTLTDTAFKARKLNVLRTLDLASKAVERAEAHLVTAASQNAGKKKATEGATATA